MPLFERNKAVKVNQLEGNILEVTAHMKDNFHEIKTVIEFDNTSKTVIDARAEMITVPFDLCLEVCARMKGLAGLRLQKGVGRSVQEIIGKKQGCSHLFDLTMDSMKALVQAGDFCLLPAEMSFDEKLATLKKVNAGICHTYSNLDRNPRYIGYDFWSDNPPGDNG